MKLAENYIFYLSLRVLKSYVSDTQARILVVKYTNVIFIIATLP